MGMRNSVMGGKEEEEADIVEPLLQRENEQHVDQEALEAWETKRWGMTRASFIILTLTLLLDSSEMSVMLPTLYQYLQSTKWTPQVDVSNELGIILSCFNVASLVAKPIIGWFGDKTSMRLTFSWTIAVAAIGNLLYSFSAYFAKEYFPRIESAGEIFILVARILSGIGCANTSLVFAYVARTVNPKKRTAQISLFSMIKLAGVFAGPLITFVTSSCDWRLGNLTIDSRNAPGLCMVVLQLLVLVALLVFLKEPMTYEQADRMEKANPSSKQHQVATIPIVGASPRVCCCCAQKSVFSYHHLGTGLLICFSALLYYSFHMASFNAFATPTLVEVHGWSSFSISLCYLLFTGTAILGNIAVILLSQQVEDTTFLLFGAILAVLAPIMMKVTFFWDMTAAPTLIVFCLFVAPVPFSFGPCRSLFTRLVEGRHYQGLLSAVISLMSSIGGIIGPLAVGVLLNVERPTDLHQPFAPRISTVYLALGAINMTSYVALLYIYKLPTPSQELSTQKQSFGV